jgi:hypothetical protein
MAEPVTASDEVLIAELADMLVRIEANYERETSGPGSRFEGQRLEVVQARSLLKTIRERARQ